MEQSMCVSGGEPSAPEYGELLCPARALVQTALLSGRCLESSTAQGGDTNATCRMSRSGRGARRAQCVRDVPGAAERVCWTSAHVWVLGLGRRHRRRGRGGESHTASWQGGLCLFKPRAFRGAFGKASHREGEALSRPPHLPRVQACLVGWRSLSCGCQHPAETSPDGQAFPQQPNQHPSAAP